MSASAATVTSKGQITIPAEIRKAMSIEPGTKIVFTRLPNGTMVMRVKSRSIMELKGILKPPKGRKVSIDDMNIGRD